jgi:hypothetical protein
MSGCISEPVISCTLSVYYSRALSFSHSSSLFFSLGSTHILHLINTSLSWVCSSSPSLEIKHIYPHHIERIPSSISSSLPPYHSPSRSSQPQQSALHRPEAVKLLHVISMQPLCRSDKHQSPKPTSVYRHRDHHVLMHMARLMVFYARHYVAHIQVLEWRDGRTEG